MDFYEHNIRHTEASVWNKQPLWYQKCDPSLSGCLDWTAAPTGEMGIRIPICPPSHLRIDSNVYPQFYEFCEPVARVEVEARWAELYSEHRLQDDEVAFGNGFVKIRPHIIARNGEALKWSEYRMFWTFDRENCFEKTAFEKTAFEKTAFLTWISSL